MNWRIDILLQNVWGLILPVFELYARKIEDNTYKIVQSRHVNNISSEQVTLVYSTIYSLSQDYMLIKF